MLSETPYDDVQAILPRLAQPGWVRWMGVPIVPLIAMTAAVNPIQHKKDLRNASRRVSRLARALKGGRVRNTVPSPLPS